MRPQTAELSIVMRSIMMWSMASSKSAKKTSSHVRIIGGKWKGRKLKFNPSADLRPTLGRTRETLFNWLRGHLQDAHCVDLFAGSGALGFEALSQGAAQVTFVEKHRRHVDQIRQHVADLGASHLAHAACCDARKNLTDNPDRYQIAFVDPPFKQPELITPVLESLVRTQKEMMFVYLESNAADTALAAIDAVPLSIHRQTRAGDALGYLLIPTV